MFFCCCDIVPARTRVTTSPGPWTPSSSFTTRSLWLPPARARATRTSYRRTPRKVLSSSEVPSTRAIKRPRGSGPERRQQRERRRVAAAQRGGSNEDAAACAQAHSQSRVVSFACGIAPSPAPRQTHRSCRPHRFVQPWHLRALHCIAGRRRKHFQTWVRPLHH